jgi:hypothetical protein
MLYGMFYGMLYEISYDHHQLQDLGQYLAHQFHLENLSTGFLSGHLYTMRQVQALYL